MTASSCLIRGCGRPAILEASGTWSGHYTVCEWHAAFYRRRTRCRQCGARMIGDAWLYRGGLCWRCWGKSPTARRARWISECSGKNLREAAS